MKEFLILLLFKIYNLLHNLKERLLNKYWNEFYKKEFKNIGSSHSIVRPNIIINPKYISIGKNFNSLYNLRLEAWDEYSGQIFSPEIIIGNSVYVNTDVHIGCVDKVVIGNDVLIASRVYISDHSHGEISKSSVLIPPALRSLTSKGPVIIEDNVWIGEGVCIMPGVTIGKNSIIGANAVVTKDVPSNVVVAGIPAKIIKLLS